MIKVAFCSYFWSSSDEARKSLSRQVPGCGYVWGDIEAVKETEDPDFFVIFQEDTDFTRKLPPNKKIYLQREPTEVESNESFLKNEGYIQSHEKSFQFVKWWVNKNYDQLVGETFPQKKYKLNTVLSHKRDLEGHKFRSNFVIDYMKKYPNELDLYGSLSSTKKVIQHIRHFPVLEKLYGHFLKLPGMSPFVDFDKHEVTLPYSYSFVAENSQHENYFTEKIVDAYLSWSMPIYWGCPNLDNFFPKDSYHEIDIYSENALEEMHRISSQPLTEKNIAAISEARNLILNKYNIWPALEEYIKDNIYE